MNRDKELKKSFKLRESEQVKEEEGMVDGGRKGTVKIRVLSIESKDATG